MITQTKSFIIGCIVILLFFFNLCKIVEHEHAKRAKLFELQRNMTSANHNQLRHDTLRASELNTLKVNNPKAALFLFNHLHEIQDIPTKFHIGKSLYQSIVINANDNYCNDSFYHFLQNPLEFDQKNAMTLYHGVDVELELAQHVNNLVPNFKFLFFNNKPDVLTTYKIDLLPNLNFFYFYRKLPEYFKFDKSFACNHQLSNQILGIFELSSKGAAGRFYNDYIKNKSLQCVERFFPETYLLTDEQECHDFFNYLNSPQYQLEKETKQFIFLKKVAALMHGGTGVSLLDNQEEESLRNLYNNGEKCGKVYGKFKESNLQMQRYISNPQLLNGKKFDFRAFMLIASTNPLIVYYHDGYITLTLDEYDPNSMDKTVHLTNTHLSGIAFKERTKDQDAEEPIWEHPYSFLQKELLKIEKVTDADWIEKNFRPQMMKIMLHIAQMSKHALLKKSNLFQLMAVDFMLDDNLKVWFIEANSLPGMPRKTLDNIPSMFSDLVEVTFSLLRSRMKRVVNYLNELSEKLPNKKDVNYKDNYPFKYDYEEHKAHFRKINSNYLEPELSISQKNGFRKILDENKEGIEKYSGLIPEDCIENVSI